MSIAYKEARETHYWLRLLMESSYIDQGKGLILIDDCSELLKILTSKIIVSQSIVQVGKIFDSNFLYIKTFVFPSLIY